jgi:hypothetical protein
LDKTEAQRLAGRAGKLSKEEDTCYIESIRSMLSDWSNETQPEAREAKRATLVSLDQLVLQRTKNKALFGFSELPLLFPPTYKLKRGQEGVYDTRKRAPAW